MKRQLNFVLLIVLAIAAFSCATLIGDPFWDELEAGDSASLKGNYAEAEKHYSQALAHAENDANRSTALHYLGMSLLSQKKYPDTEDAFKREIEAAERAYGSGHPRLFDSLSDITLLYIRLNRWDDAAGYDQRAILIATKVSRDENKTGIELTETLRDIIARNKGQQSK